MNPLKRTRGRGFTLAELLIAMALMALLMVAAGLAIEAAESSRSFNAEKSALVARVRGSLDRISQDLRRAASFEVVDAHTVAVRLPTGWVHTYSWDGTLHGNLNYTETDPATISIEHPQGVPSDPATLTGFVETFVVTDTSPSCSVQITLAHNTARCQTSMTATPRKSLF